ncbi:MAG TPA: hypothetical protein ENN80_08945, partial [Candidatus Hydrogenedentes bacterium]|nr:hypothetical protein [Candidatus Hydrogenedentota bacterium]
PVNMSVGIRPLDPLMPYKQRIVYRAADYQIGYIPQSEWAEMPRDTVTRALLDALVASNRFADVGDAADLRNPDCVLTGELRRFDQDRSSVPWQAVCEMRIELRVGLLREAVWSGTIVHREPLAQEDTAALAAAMSKAVARVVEDAASQITAVEFPERDASEIKEDPNG